ncbi:MAG: hypothetical protein IJ004_05865 [Clostridia bacterium]|nr:hypothetical protein [Clostridia bacterium]
MDTIQAFTSYFKENVDLYTNKIKNPENHFSTLLSKISPQNLDKIYRLAVKKRIKFGTCSSYYYYSHKNTVYFKCGKATDPVSFFHELAHALDNLDDASLKRYNYTQTSKRIHVSAPSAVCTLSNGTSLDRTLRREVKENALAIYQIILAKFVSEVVKELEPELASNYTKRLQLCVAYSLAHYSFTNCTSLRAKDELRKVYSSLLCKIKYTNDYANIDKRVLASEVYKRFTKKYSVILDMLSSQLDITRIFPGHSIGYFSLPSHYGVEFFAECFANKVLGIEDSIELAKIIYPVSYQLFEELYDKIMSDAV